MSVQNSSLRLPAIIILTAGFVSAYLVASWLDLQTTELALRAPHAAEGNVFAVSKDGYEAERAWWFTGIGGLLVTAYFVFGAANLHRMSDYWLRRPLLSFCSLWSNPFASFPWLRTVINRSPLHAISIAVAFVLLRLFAALNNWMIATTGDGPLSFAIRTASQSLSPLAAFVAVILSVYAAIVLAVSLPIARMILKGMPDRAR
jgi:hypothetical protein